MDGWEQHCFSDVKDDLQNRIKKGEKQVGTCHSLTMIYSETYKNVYVRPGEGKHVSKVSNPSLSVVRDL